MTCIVALTDQKTVWMGGDSFLGNSYNKRTTAIKKVFTVKNVNLEMLVGYTSSVRMGQILEHHLAVNLPSYIAGSSLMEYMVTQFVEAVRELFKQLGFTKIHENVESGGEFLVGWQGQIFQIQGDYQVSQWQENYCAVGAGEDYALGSLASTKGEPGERLIRAMKSAAMFSPYVSPPYYVMELGE